MTTSSNGHIILNGFKGIWTLDEVIELLQSHNLKVKVSLISKEDYQQSLGKSSNQEKEEVR